LHNEELHRFYSSPNTLFVRINQPRVCREWGMRTNLGYVNYIQNLGWKLGRRPFERPKQIRKDIIKINLKKYGV
jgi:hypothetical protein